MTEENKWIKQIQRKSDEKAANLVVSYYYKPIYSFVYKQTLNKELSKDLTQEVFISMLQSIHQYDRKKSAFKTWLYRIATYRIVDYFRSKHYKYDHGSDSIEELEISGEGDFTIILEYKEDIEKITSLINELDTFSQQVIRLKLFAENTFAEMACTLDRPESSVKTKYYSALKLLKQRMEWNGK